MKIPVRIQKPWGPVQGTVVLGGSKSIANRLLIIEALCGENIPMTNFPQAADSLLLRNLLSNWGPTLNAQDAGTVMRFVTALAAVRPGEYFITGTERMQQRPIDGLVDALRRLGADIEYVGNTGYPPLRIRGKKLTGGMVRVDTSVSSQFASALLLIAPTLEQGLQLELIGQPVSMPYVELTLALMHSFGIDYVRQGNTIHISHQPYRPRSVYIEADWSAASYFYEIAALSDHASITLKGLQWPSLQGDAIIAELMQSFGVRTDPTSEGLIITKKKGEKPLVTQRHFDLRNHPDLAPALFATAAGLSCSTSFVGLEHLAHKESNREQAFQTELERCGIKLHRLNHVLQISGSFQAVTPVFQTYQDHRLAMALAPLALCCTQVTIDDGQVVNKSYPAYWNDLAVLGFQIDY